MALDDSFATSENVIDIPSYTPNIELCEYADICEESSGVRGCHKDKCYDCDCFANFRRGIWA
jgi:hypothetical protein